MPSWFVMGKFTVHKIIDIAKILTKVIRVELFVR